MTAVPTPAQVAQWQADYREHSPRIGGCPKCDHVTGRCPTWVRAYADLVTFGYLPETTPTASPGGNPTAGQPEGDNQ